METIKKLDMLKSLDTYLNTNKSVKIIKTDGSMIIGDIIDLKKGPAAEFFLDPKTGNVFDSPDIIIELLLKVDSSDNPIKIGFRDISNFEPKA